MMNPDDRYEGLDGLLRLSEAFLNRWSERDSSVTGSNLSKKSSRIRCDSAAEIILRVIFPFGCTIERTCLLVINLAR